MNPDLSPELGRLSVCEAAAGWRWRIVTPDGRTLEGDAASLETACRTGAFAAAAGAALARICRRRF